ncbi:oxygenase MpaB family protein [Kitasatospora sp. NPDC049285]|uniref:oxygenase MpaB family protein n=1 Tax=Kitasatospora sp. NPDC049285 TaxID=3157096 RepID=UPI00343798EE
MSGQPHDRARHRDAFAELVLHRAPQRARVGLTLGFVRTFAVPEIAEVLVGTGKLTAEPKARAKATGAVMFSLIGHGVASPEGRRLVAELAALHRRLPGAGGDLMRYVLACFTVYPVEFTARHGGVRPAERTAAFAFQAELARALELTPLPGPTLAQTRCWMREFEDARFAPSPAARLLWQATSGLLATRLPGPLARHAPAFAAALLDAPLRRVLDVPRPAWPIRTAAAAAFRLIR